MFPPRANLQRNIRRIEIPAQRIRVFPQNHLAHIVHEVLLIYRNERRRRIGPFDPDLPRQHAAVDSRLPARAVLLSPSRLQVRRFANVEQCLD
jgi:hypothetical protein